MPGMVPQHVPRIVPARENGGAAAGPFRRRAIHIRADRKQPGPDPAPGQMIQNLFIRSGTISAGNRSPVHVVHRDRKPARSCGLSCVRPEHTRAQRGRAESRKEIPPRHHSAYDVPSRLFLSDMLRTSKMPGSCEFTACPASSMITFQSFPPVIGSFGISRR
jgi:hypothetical protein